jgi:hypothetical protein
MIRRHEGSSAGKHVHSQQQFELLLALDAEISMMKWLKEWSLV